MEREGCSSQGSSHSQLSCLGPDVVCMNCIPQFSHHFLPALGRACRSARANATLGSQRPVVLSYRGQHWGGKEGVLGPGPPSHFLASGDAASPVRMRIQLLVQAPPPPIPPRDHASASNGRRLRGWAGQNEAPGSKLQRPRSSPSPPASGTATPRLVPGCSAGWSSLRSGAGAVTCIPGVPLQLRRRGR